MNIYLALGLIVAALIAGAYLHKYLASRAKKAEQWASSEATRLKDKL